MKKRALLFLLGLSLSLSAGVCSAEETELAFPDSEEVSAELEPFQFSDYILADALQYVTLGDLDGIPVEKTIYKITDDMLENQLDMELQAYGEEKPADRPAQENDIVYASLTYTPQSTGETDTEPDFVTSIGDEYYGEEFDQKLIGSSVGDVLEFTLTFEEDDWMTDWPGDTVDFKVEIAEVNVYEVPEFNDAFVQDNFGYATTEEYLTSFREMLEEQYNANSDYEASQTVLQSAMDLCEFNGYPQEYFDSLKSDFIESYSAFVGGDGTAASICEAFGITEEELDQEILTSVNLDLMVNAYIIANNIDISEAEYLDYLDELASQYGYPSGALFESDYSRKDIVGVMVSEKVSSLIYENASVTEVEYDEDAAFGDFDLEDLEDADVEFLDEEDWAEDDLGEVYDITTGEYIDGDDLIWIDEEKEDEE